MRTRSLTKAVLALGIVFTALALTGCGIAEGRSRKTYRGVVFDAATRQPVAGAQVEGSYFVDDFTEMDDSTSLDRTFGAASRPRTRETLTDVNGHFELRLGGSNRWLSFTAPGYQKRQLSVETWPVKKDIVILLGRGP